MLNEMFQTHKHQIYSSDEYSLSNSSGKQDGFFYGSSGHDQDWLVSGMDLRHSDEQLLFSGSDTTTTTTTNNNNISKHGLIISNHHINPQLQHQYFSGFGTDGDYNLDPTPQNLSSSSGNGLSEDIICIDSQNSPKIKNLSIPSPEPFGILKKYRRRCRRLNGEKLNVIPIIFHDQKDDTSISSHNQQLSIEQIIHLASEKFIQSTTSEQNDETSTISHPYPTSFLHQACGGSSIQLVQLLLSSAEKVGEKQYERARKSLEGFENSSFSRGSPIERLVFYFIEALHEKIDRETGTISQKGLGEKIEDPILSLSSPNKTLIAFHKELPLSQVNKFAGIQAVVDSVADARKVHYIDLEIRTGIQCTILMQALADRCQHLKITAVGTKLKENIEETGRQLMSFAQTLDLEFTFNVVMVDSILNLDKSMFGIREDEAVVVYAAYILNMLIGQQDQLEHLMKVIRTINPCVMVVTEVEADCNNPNFVERFVESLFFFGAFFESFAQCFKSDEEQRFVGESTCFRSAIRNIVAAEGEERKIRHVGMRVWRAFFTRFGFEEMELSMSSVYQANLVTKNFDACGSSFTFDFDGKSLIIGWKGTPMSSLSSWKLPSLIE